MPFPPRSLTVVGAAALATTLAAVLSACSGSSDGASAAASDPSPISTVTTTATASAPSATGAPVTGTPSATTSTTGGGTASGPGLCTPTVATFAVGQQDGAAGTVFLPVTVTNAAQQSCVTTGYPGVALLDDTGRQIAQAARETGAGLSSTTITLAPGEQATALISATPADANGKDCAASPAFLFTLPDNTDSTKLSGALPICNVQVRPFVKGTTGLN